MPIAPAANPPSTEALPLAVFDPRGPQGCWIVFNDGARGFYARRLYFGVVMVLWSDDKIEGETLDAVRAQLALLPGGLINVGRHEDETEPTVVETWV